MNCNAVIVRFTTPTIQVNFKAIDPEAIVEAFLVFKLNGEEVLSKDISSAYVHKGDAEDPESYISWVLSQEETGGLELNSRLTAYCDWKVEDGTRGRSRAKEFQIADTGKDEVI